MKSITERHEAAMVEAQKTCRSRPLERLKRGCVHKDAVGDLVRVKFFLNLLGFVTLLNLQFFINDR